MQSKYAQRMLHLSVAFQCSVAGCLNQRGPNESACLCEGPGFDGLVRCKEHENAEIERWELEALGLEPLARQGVDDLKSPMEEAGVDIGYQEYSKLLRSNAHLFGLSPDSRQLALLEVVLGLDDDPLASLNKLLADEGKLARMKAALSPSWLRETRGPASPTGSTP